MNDYLLTIGSNARHAAKQLRSSTAAVRNATLLDAASLIEKQKDEIGKANLLDIAAAKKENKTDYFIDRLCLNSEKIDRMVDSIRSVARLPEVVGAIDSVIEQPTGIKVGTMRVPIGVIAIIYEARPNVTAECASLCIKSANAVLLRGGTESTQSNRIISQAFTHALEKNNIPIHAVQLVDQVDRALIPEFLKMDSYIDLVIPRGGKGLISVVREHAKIPRLDHLDGVCHIYCDESCNQAMAVAICVNAKIQRFAMCNTVETILVHQAIAPSLVPKISQAYLDKNVEIRGCPHVCSLVSEATPATEDDWYEEYLAPIIAIRVVTDISQAIAHIEQYGSHHTDSIISSNHSAIETFMVAVDSSSVMANTSTRFADGFEYGLGAEIGIATAKLHARGPVGLEGLTTKKFVVYSNGATRNT